MEEKRYQYAVAKWEKRAKRLHEFGARCDVEIRKLKSPIREWMTYLYATLPVADLVNYPTETWIPYIEHALMLRRTAWWCRSIDEQTFIDYVFYPRINTEDMEECRRLFYRQLWDKVCNLSEEQAVLEINYWCQQHVTYQQADDRTKSAMTVYRSGFGRCGEESTFVVNVLRSVGIPARQIYAPWWSHCDDNHAWVEVLADGRWHFIGACEPQQKLDIGWFNNAASRSMFMVTRTFTGAENDRDLAFLYGDKADRFHLEEGVAYEIVTDHYARVTHLTVHVTGPDGKAAANVPVRFEILNMAGMMPACVIHTDAEGTVRLMVGKGSLNLHAYTEADPQMTGITDKDQEPEDVKPLLSAEKLITIGQADDGDNKDVTLVLADQTQTITQNQWIPFDFMAPLDAPVNPSRQTEDEKHDRDRRIRLGDSIRQFRRDSFYKNSEAEKLTPDLHELLREAGGNFNEIYQFLNEAAFEDDIWREKLLKVLTKKDLCDVSRGILEDHLYCSLPYLKGCDPDVFVKYVLNPRVYNETLTAYRAYIQNFFTPWQQHLFRRSPKKIMTWIRENLKVVYDIDYKDLYNTPAASLSSGLTGTVGYKILFVAVCRTLGIPARLDPVTSEPQYFKGGRFVSADPVKAIQKGYLKLTAGGEDWVYRQSVTVSKIDDQGIYRRIDIEAPRADKTVRSAVEAGSYRLLTVNRLPNGHQYAYAYYFTVEKGQETSLVLKKRPVDLKEMLAHNQIDDFTVNSQPPVMASSLLTERTNLLLWLDEGREPTEHILNEMMENCEDFESLKAGIFFFVQSKEALKQPTLARAAAMFPKVHIVEDKGFENVEPLERRMYVDAGKLPLVIVTHEGLCGYFAGSGYNPGLGNLLVRIVRALES